ncbi:type VII secretion protein EccB [Mycobacterium talmoniae]|nr:MULTISPECIES: type VII secretion protein EccB [Mycobacterium]OHV02779.1 type VII secretion protein EccB [Mycobacterium talmoniae]TDH48804.1 type VII secretion protein EccB [Mycobacterium eburneum]
MPAQVTTRAQVNGYRFLLRRLEHALIRADSRMIHDPMRGQIRSLMVGVVMAVLITGACGVLAFFKPSPNIGNAQILLSKSSGALFVKIGDRVHPVLNVTSARLITGQPDTPKQVDDKWLNDTPRGPMVGIIGAPASIRPGDDLGKSSWTVCDTVQTPDVAKGTGMAGLETTVLANDPVLNDDIRAATPAQMVAATDGKTVFLIYNGVRAPVDPQDPIVVNALHLQGTLPRPISPGLLNAFPLVPPIRPVVISGVGDTIPSVPPAYRVGSIIKTVDSKGEQLYVVLRDGLQPVSAATADIIRYSNPEIPTAGTQEVAPAVVSGVPVVHELPVDHYPTVSPEIVNLEPERVMCMSWQRANTAAQATTRLLVGHRLPLPSGAQPVRLATADGNGPGLDSVYLKPGSGEFVQATGGDVDSRATGRLFYVSDTGLRYLIKDLPTAAALGVTGVKDPDSDAQLPQFAPWPVLSLLPPGPELSQEAALVAHDGMAADPTGLKVDPPKH